MGWLEHLAGLQPWVAAVAVVASATLFGWRALLRYRREMAAGRARAARDAAEHADRRELTKELRANRVALARLTFAIERKHDDLDNHNMDVLARLDRIEEHLAPCNGTGR